MHIQLRDLAETPRPPLGVDQSLSRVALRAPALESGADDAGVVAIERQELDAASRPRARAEMTEHMVGHLNRDLGDGQWRVGARMRRVS